MPIISLPANTMTPDAPAPVLDQQRRPTVDNSAVAAGIQQLANAQKKPEISGDALAAPYTALGTVGQAISKAGDVVGALALKQQEAQGDIQVADADGKMDQARSDFEAWKIDNPDTTKWNDEWKQRLDGVKGTVLDDNSGLTPQARQQIALRLARYSGQSTADVMAGTAKQTFAKAKSVYLATIDQATDNQDQGRFDEAVTTAQSRGYLYPHEAEALKERYTKTGEQKDREAKAKGVEDMVNNAVTFAGASGEDIALKNIDGGMFDAPGFESTPLQREQARNAVQAYSNDRRAQAREILVNGIASGDLNSPEKIDAAVVGTPMEKFVTPEILKSAHEYARSYNKEQAQIDQEENGAKNFSDEYNKVAMFDRTAFPTDKDAQLAAFNLRLEIEQKVGKQDDGWLAQQLWRKSNATPPPFKPTDEIKKLVNDRIGTLFDGKTGIMPYQWQVQEKDGKTGKPVFDSNNLPKTKWVVNPDNEQENAVAQTVVRQKVDDWMKANPMDAKDPVKVNAAINGFRPEGAKVSVWNSLRGAMTSPPPASPTAVPESLVSTMKQTEGFNPHAFGDYKQMSIGYGTRAKFSGEVVSEPQADQRLRQELSASASNIDRAAQQGGYKLSPGQRNALISFDYNTGEGAHLLSTAGGSLPEVKRRLLLYTKAGGQESSGLVKRRKMEADMMGL